MKALLFFIAIYALRVPLDNRRIEYVLNRPSQAEIAQRAYDYWLKGEADAYKNWLQAENDLTYKIQLRVFYALPKEIFLYPCIVKIIREIMRNDTSDFQHTESYLKGFMRMIREGL